MRILISALFALVAGFTLLWVPGGLIAPNDPAKALKIGVAVAAMASIALLAVSELPSLKQHPQAVDWLRVTAYGLGIGAGGALVFEEILA